MYRLLVLVALVGCTQGLYGGEEASITQFPYQAAIRERKFLKCGATIINKEFVLTKNSCINAFLENFKILTGSDVTNEGIEHDIEKVYVHSLIGVSLIKVSPPITFSPTQQPIKLVDPDFKLQPNTTLTSSGFGYTSGFLPSSHLRSAPTKSLLLEDCVKRYRSRLTALYPGLLCVEGEGDCSGDEGNPLVSEDGRLVAVATSRHSCGKGDQPDLYVQVAKAVGWIRTVTGV